jgi:hypothetical protein
MDLLEPPLAKSVHFAEAPEGLDVCATAVSSMMVAQQQKKRRTASAPDLVFTSLSEDDAKRRRCTLHHATVGNEPTFSNGSNRLAALRGHLQRGGGPSSTSRNNEKSQSGAPSKALSCHTLGQLRVSSSSSSLSHSYNNHRREALLAKLHDILENPSARGMPRDASSGLVGEERERHLEEEMELLGRGLNARWTNQSTPPRPATSNPLLASVVAQRSHRSTEQQGDCPRTKKPVVSPTSYLRSFFPENQKKRALEYSFSSPTEERRAAYCTETVTAIRNRDTAALRELLLAGRSFDACNANGETLLHLACRRGDVETVKFLLTEADVDPSVRDDMGRTVLHDVCWRPVPDLPLMDVLLPLVPPDTLLSEDRRGHTCFDYCRREHWNVWVKYLEKRIDIILKPTEAAEIDSSSAHSRLQEDSLVILG